MRSTSTRILAAARTRLGLFRLGPPTERNFLAARLLALPGPRRRSAECASTTGLSAGGRVDHAFGGREDLEAIGVPRAARGRLRPRAGSHRRGRRNRRPGPASRADLSAAGLGFKWNMGWMQVTLRRDPA